MSRLCIKVPAEFIKAHLTLSSMAEILQAAPLHPGDINENSAPFIILASQAVAFS
jgi:hypothetical protein